MKFPDTLSSVVSGEMHDASYYPLSFQSNASVNYITLAMVIASGKP